MSILFHITSRENILFIGTYLESGIFVQCITPDNVDVKVGVSLHLDINQGYHGCVAETGTIDFCNT